MAAVAACGTTSGGKSDDESTGCGTCEQETKALGVKISQIDGVTKVASISYATRKALTRPPAVTVDAAIAANSLGRVRPAMVKAIWDSQITPLEDVILTLKTPNGRAQLLRFQFTKGTKEYTAYRDAWGPRPVK